MFRRGGEDPPRFRFDILDTTVQYRSVLDVELASPARTRFFMVLP